MSPGEGNSLAQLVQDLVPPQCPLQLYSPISSFTFPLSPPSFPLRYRLTGSKRAALWQRQSTKKSSFSCVPFSPLLLTLALVSYQCFWCGEGTA